MCIYMKENARAGEKIDTAREIKVTFKLFETKEDLGKTNLDESSKVVTNVEWIPFSMYFKQFVGHPIGHHHLHVASSNHNHCTHLQV